MDVLGVDIGGTFTDFYFVRDGDVEVHKRPSTPDNPSRAILEGIREQAWQPEAVVHGSTVATNTVLERNGARVAFVTTAGFEDLLEIGRQARPRVYELEPKRAPHLVAEELCFGVMERLDYRGEVLRDLTHDEITQVVSRISAAAPDAVAVCLLFAFLNPKHELMLKAALLEADFEVAISSEVAREPREFERASTTVLSAYVGPRMRRYLDDLSTELKAAGCDHLSIVQSNGGTLPAQDAGRLAVNTLLSGPAAGVTGAFTLAKKLGFDRVITFDMGGTSTDVCLCDGFVPFTSEWKIAEIPVRLPAVDVHTVGSGGGSVALIDEGGALRVGPQSAGADPGPAAYGKGGPATTTDAHLVLGRLGTRSLLGGDFAVNLDAARHAMSGLGLTNAIEAAQGVIEVANTVMARAMRVVSTERGHDPAEFTLVGYGGAGPLHACELAEALGIPRVLVPPHPGLMSAIGMTQADTTRDYVLPLLESQSPDLDVRPLEGLLRDKCADLETIARNDLAGRVITEASVDMRYEGQGHELNVPWDDRSAASLLEAFHAQYEQRYGYSDRGRTVELITLRLRGRVPRGPVREPNVTQGNPDARAAIAGKRLVHLREATEVPVYDRSKLLAGNEFTGPGIVEQVDSTTLIREGWSAAVAQDGTLVLTRGFNGS